MRSKISIHFSLFFFIFSISVIAQTSDNYEKALQSFNENKINETFIHLKNALKENSTHLPSKILLAKVHVLRKEGDFALDYIQEAIELGADLNLTTLTQAQAYILNRDYLKLLALTEVKLSEQNEFELLLLKASAYQSIGQDNDALIKYKQALVMQQHNIVALSGITSFHLRQGNIEKVHRFLSQIKTIAPDSYFYLYIKGQLFEQDNKNNKALDYFEKAYHQSPSNGLISRSLANIYIKLREYSKARAIVNDILEKTPDEPFIMLLNARLYTINKESGLADDAYNELVEKLLLVPSNIMEQMPELLYISGVADYMMGGYESAQQKLKTYINAKSDNINAIVLLVDVYLKQDQTYKAISLLESHYQLIENHLSTALKQCNLYIQDKKAFKCNVLLVNLKRIHGESDSLNFMQIKVLQNFKQYPEALTLYEEKLSTSQAIQIKKLGVSLYMLNNKHKEALIVINELLKQSSTNLNYQLTKTDVLIGLKEFNQAEKVLESVLKLQPNSLKAKFNQTQILFFKEEYYEAQKQAEKLLINEPNSFRLYTLLGNTLLGQKKFEPALDAFLKAQKFSSNNPAALEQTVKLYRMSGKLELALEELNKLGKQFFLEPKYIQQKAEIYVIQEEYEQAAREFKLLFGLWGDNHQLLLVLAQMQREAKLYQDAEISLMKSLEIKPSFLYSKIELLRIYLIQNQIDKAEPLAKKLFKSNAINANVQLLYGDVEYAKSKYEKAHKHYLKALELNNNYFLAAIKLYKLAQNKGMGEDIFEKTILGIVTQHEGSHFHRNLLADFYLGKNESKKAIVHYEILEKVESLPNKKYVYNNLANLYLEHDLIKALNYVEKAIIMDNANANFYDTKGWILVLQDNFKSGLNSLRQSYAINSSNPTNRYHIAYVLHKLNRDAEAKIELKAALSINNHFTEIEQAKELQDSIF